jgi:hypothetical protein
MGDGSVLTSRELRDQPVRVRWCTHIVHEVTRTRRSPPTRPVPDRYCRPVPIRRNARATAAAAGFGRPA